jgi:hypothetical protein
MTYQRLIGFALLACACSNGPTADQAAQQSAQAVCSQLMTCSAAAFQKRWPDLATCEAREKLSVLDALNAKNTAQTPKNIEACATEIAQESCDQFLSGDMPTPHCVTPSGPAADGAACTFNAQCKTGFCSVAATALCGTCAEPPAAGASCASQGCGQTMICVRSTMMCQVPVAVGGSCSTMNPCGVGLACVGATATANGMCQTQVATLGASCDHTLRTAPNCNQNDGLTCAAMGAALDTCVMQPIVPAQQACGQVMGVANACAASATCIGTGTMTCIAPATDGAACDTASGPDCEFPAKCVTSGATAGTCELPGSTSC